jgi:hypothetical protein
MCKLGRSRPRLFGDEASDIASELIAMTLLQQQKRAQIAPSKKQSRIRGRITWLSGMSTAYSSRVWHLASFSEEIAAVDCVERRSLLGGLLTSPS